jgi:hypothetical protein
MRRASTPGDSAAGPGVPARALKPLGRGGPAAAAAAAAAAPLHDAATAAWVSGSPLPVSAAPMAFFPAPQVASEAPTVLMPTARSYPQSLPYVLTPLQAGPHPVPASPMAPGLCLSPTQSAGALPTVTVAQAQSQLQVAQQQLQAMQRQQAAAADVVSQLGRARLEQQQAIVMQQRLALEERRTVLDAWLADHSEHSGGSSAGAPLAAPPASAPLMASGWLVVHGGMGPCGGAGGLGDASGSLATSSTLLEAQMAAAGLASGSLPAPPHGGPLPSGPLLLPSSPLSGYAQFSDLAGGPPPSAPLFAMPLPPAMPGAGAGALVRPLPPSGGAVWHPAAGDQGWLP